MGRCLVADGICKPREYSMCDLHSVSCGHLRNSPINFVRRSPLQPAAMAFCWCPRPGSSQPFNLIDTTKYIDVLYFLSYFWPTKLRSLVLLDLLSNEHNFVALINFLQLNTFSGRLWPARTHLPAYSIWHASFCLNFAYFVSSDKSPCEQYSALSLNLLSERQFSSFEPMVLVLCNTSS